MRYLILALVLMSGCATAKPSDEKTYVLFLSAQVQGTTTFVDKVLIKHPVHQPDGSLCFDDAQVNKSACVRNEYLLQETE